MVQPESDGLLLMFGDGRGRRWALTPNSEGCVKGANQDPFADFPFTDMPCAGCKPNRAGSADRQSAGRRLPGKWAAGGHAAPPHPV